MLANRLKRVHVRNDHNQTEIRVPSISGLIENDTGEP